jgi:hypothetical protein
MLLVCQWSNSLLKNILIYIRHQSRDFLWQIRESSISKVFFTFGFHFLNCFNSIQTFSLICLDQTKISSSSVWTFCWMWKLNFLLSEAFCFKLSTNINLSEWKLIDNTFNERIKVDFVKEQRRSSRFADLKHRSVTDERI